MKFALKIIATLILIPALLIGGLVFYWWATYIDESVISGRAYGFTIGHSKQIVAQQFPLMTEDYPELHVNVSYGRRAGDNFSIPANKQAINLLMPHNKWDLLLNGQWEFFDSIDLYFENDKLVKIHRHRQNFELP